MWYPLLLHHLLESAFFFELNRYPWIAAHGLLPMDCYPRIDFYPRIATHGSNPTRFFLRTVTQHRRT